jgi:hypothetical protein
VPAAAALPQPTCGGSLLVLFSGVQDLLPAEIAGSRRQATSPMRTPRSGSGSPGRDSGSLTNAATAAAQPPSLPAAATAAAPAVPSVDGVPDSVVDAWFQQADADGDGRVADSEARDFFLTSGLAAADLSKVRRALCCCCAGRRGILLCYAVVYVCMFVGVQI